MAVDWSKLHDDLLLLIFQWLPIPDLLRSAAVCMSWRSASGQLCHHRIPSFRRSPWLLYSDASSTTANHRNAVEADAFAKFYSFPENRYYKIPLPTPHFAAFRCCIISSSQGWLITVDNSRSELQLLNPITGEQIDDDLPPVSSFDHMVRAPARLRHFVYYKAALSSNPSHGSYTLVIIHGPNHRLSFARAGDDKWTTIASDSIYQNLIFHQGNLYAMCCCGNVEVWDLERDIPVTVAVVAPAPAPAPARLHRYLIPDPRADQAFLVFREPGKDCRLKFSVYRIKKDEYTMVGVESLGSYALFISSNHSVCLSRMEFPALRPNCVYFIDDDDDNDDGEQDRRVPGIGIYSLDDGSVQLACRLDDGWSWKRAVWFIA